MTETTQHSMPEFSLSDLDLNDPIGTLSTVVRLYEESITAFNSESTPTTKREKEYRDKLAGSKANRKIASSFAGEIAERLYDFLADNPQASAALVDALNDQVVDSVKDYRDMVVTEHCAQNRPVQKTDTNARAQLEQLRMFSVQFYNIAQTMGKPIPEDVPTKQNKAGQTVLDISNLPHGTKGASNTTAARGRHAVRQQYLWTVDGESLPDGTIPARVATHYCRGNRRGMYEAIENQVGKDAWSQNEFTFKYNERAVLAYRNADNTVEDKDTKGVSDAS